jgi:hypothetical protein
VQQTALVDTAIAWMKSHGHNIRFLKRREVWDKIASILKLSNPKKRSVRGESRSNKYMWPSLAEVKARISEFYKDPDHFAEEEKDEIEEDDVVMSQGSVEY